MYARQEVDVSEHDVDGIVLAHALGFALRSQATVTGDNAPSLDATSVNLRPAETA
jgi:hypothetical protein